MCIYILFSLHVSVFLDQLKSDIVSFLLLYGNGLYGFTCTLFNYDGSISMLTYKVTFIDEIDKVCLLF